LTEGLAFSSFALGVPALAPGLVVVADGFPFLAGLLSAPFSSGGASTTKRYLHLGQSILRPTSPISRMGTIASQLGQVCLKLTVVAMCELPPFAGQARDARLRLERFLHLRREEG